MTDAQNSRLETGAEIRAAQGRQDGDAVSDGDRDGVRHKDHAGTPRLRVSLLGASAGPVRNPRRSLFRC
jgi:hypothetical protein